MPLCVADIFDCTWFVVNNPMLLCGFKQTKGTIYERSQTGPCSRGHQLFCAVGLCVLGLDPAKLAAGDSLCCAALRDQQHQGKKMKHKIILVAMLLASAGVSVSVLYGLWWLVRLV
jgi:hypothetical protein